MAGTSEESSVEDVVSSFKIKEVGSESQGGQDEDSDNSEENEEEYVVEKILQHQYDLEEEGFKYEVKWEGWADTTWEPLENLKETEELNRYHKSIGGPPTMIKGLKGPKATAKQPPAKKRRLTKDTTVTSSDISNSKSGGRGQARPPNLASAMSDRDWESDIIQVETLEQDFKEGVIVGYVRWANGEKSKHRLATLNNKCPQQMLRFYEAHLQFNQNSSSANAIGAGKDRTCPCDSQIPVIKEDEISSNEHNIPQNTPS